MSVIKADLRRVFPNATAMVERLLKAGSIRYNGTVDDTAADEWIDRIIHGD